MHLDWMIPAPAQGALCIVTQSTNKQLLEICAEMNDNKTMQEVQFERNFLRALMGGCSMPIGGLATIAGQDITFEGCILSIDGKHKRSVSLVGHVAKTDELLRESIDLIHQNGGSEILHSFKKDLSQ